MAQRASSILVVDDDALVGNAMRRVLERAGHEVVYESDPEEALRRLAAHAFDLVLTDLMMPRIDGLELLRHAKRLRPSCAVILMTAFGGVDTAREASKRGAVDFLTKPFSPEGDLLPLIVRVLARSPGAGDDDVSRGGGRARPARRS